MNNLPPKRRVDEIINFLRSLRINSERFIEKINKKDIDMINLVNEALTHSSANQKINHEQLEFFGDAVLRLSASEFIDKKFPNINVGKRSELRAQIVSDEWLRKLGEKINIEELVLVGSKSMGNDYSKNTILAETSEALIGAIYKIFDSIKEINLWLDEYWEKDSKDILQAPYKFNAKSALQEWCQDKGINLPEYKIKEVTKKHGDPKRFLCELYINGMREAKSYGQSHKKAEKNAATIVIENIYLKGKL